jgi:hypothetical protein
VTPSLLTPTSADSLNPKPQEEVIMAFDPLFRDKTPPKFCEPTEQIPINIQTPDNRLEVQKLKPGHERRQSTAVSSCISPLVYAFPKCCSIKCSISSTLYGFARKPCMPDALARSTHSPVISAVTAMIFGNVTTFFASSMILAVAS